ncbi:MAG: PilZ domain-containing protein [Bdellovibrionales bacterium]
MQQETESQNPCLKYPKDMLLLALSNTLLCLISFKNLLGYFNSQSIESWLLLSLISLGLLTSLGFLKFKKWSFYSFHLFGFLLVVTAGTQLYFHPTSNYYYSFVAAVSYCAIGSLVLHNHLRSACFSPFTQFIERFPVKLPATITIDEQKIDAKVVDISETGVFVEAESPLQLGDCCHINIEVPTGDINMRSSVMRIAKDKSGYGLMFTGCDRRRFANKTDAVHSLIHYIENQSKTEPKKPGLPALQ